MKLETAKKKQPEKWGQVNPSHSSPWHHPNIFHFILFSKNNNRKQTFLSSYQVSFVNTQKGNCFLFSLLPQALGFIAQHLEMEKLKRKAGYGRHSPNHQKLRLNVGDKDSPTSIRTLRSLQTIRVHLLLDIVSIRPYWLYNISKSWKQFLCAFPKVGSIPWCHPASVPWYNLSFPDAFTGHPRCVIRAQGLGGCPSHQETAWCISVLKKINLSVSLPCV